MDNLLFVMVVLTTFNCNGLHDQQKWHLAWKFLNATQADVLILQETHLQSGQEYAFRLYAQAYCCYFLHDTSQSAGVAVCVRWNNGMTIEAFQAISPHLAVLDVWYKGQLLCFLACYAPPHSKERTAFFQGLAKHIHIDATIVMGDLNTVHTQQDRLSQCTDSTTDIWNQFCHYFQLSEALGANFYTY